MPLRYRFIRKAVIVGTIGLPVLGLVVGENIARAADGKTPATLEVYYQNNTLTVNLRDAPLQQVLQHISQQTGVKFYGKVKEKTVSDSFRNLPVDQAVNRLLGGHNFVAFFASADPEPGVSSSVVRLTEVWIVSARGPISRAASPKLLSPSPTRRVKRPAPAANVFEQALEQTGDIPHEGSPFEPPASSDSTAAGALRQPFEREKRNRGDDGAASNPFLGDEPFVLEQQ